MPLIEQSEALAILKKHSPHIRKIFFDAEKDAIEGQTAFLRMRLGPGASAFVMSDLVYSRAAEYSDRAEEVTYHEHAQMRLICIDGRIAIRFRKLNNDTKSHTHETQQDRDFRAQIPVPLFGISPSHNLEAGYTTDSLGKVANIYYVCPSGENNNSWVSEILEDSTQSIAQDIFADRAAQDAQEPEITPKREHINTIEDDESGK